MITEINKSWSCLNASLLKRCSGFDFGLMVIFTAGKGKNPVWTLFFANRTFDKYQKYFRISVCILVQTFCKCQTACVICDIWHLRWSLMFEIFSCNARDVYINVLASSRHLAPFQECVLQGKCNATFTGCFSIRKILLTHVSAPFSK